ncbi:dolichyl-P-Man:Man5GlcNAc2-PP-dolichol alpha-1,3-mannosyltransferase [Synchytrium microbalum]|uniref:Dol-P-Man:Man(5)GlcNAc(2)-PP-Dol alpha-1,3-mannosyltransferase n=1 Tax=Synchytrium microbalum TaxID=1806994 RepID=A0A507C5Y5_9FUNG|nr:dolichyl-P-Man:Man5GlcNAc2-PP-dolichol alpha-1,3-mannosyltransferase [Synchytrium microbalum]TPX35052.1 dolichyl-P-Man:Man5GlcNAc2-PP-dolichol alpha-1,3-mannosyltransferase [Synchytrium microbalum]
MPPSSRGGDDIHIVQQPNLFSVLLSAIWKFVSSILQERAFFWYLFVPIMVFELALNALIIWKIPYTEIDWIAYMQEVGGFLAGERDYTMMEGDTGPLVYPAGFVYIYSVLSIVTGSGTSILLAQWLFAVLYMTTLAIVLLIYRESRLVPPYVIILVCLSRRLHSIYVLRLFNDGWAMLFLYLAVLAMVWKRWTVASILYSFAISIKMNILLFAPAFALIIFKAQMWTGTIFQGLLVVLVQVLLGLPFLIHAPKSYLTQAFQFNRVFMYKWTVNWKFLPEEAFLSPMWAAILIWAHVLTLFGFLLWPWCRREGGFRALLKTGFGLLPAVELFKQPPLRSDHIIHLMFTCNFVGIVFSRSLHYQFYSWYYMALPYLLWRTRFPVLLRLVLLVVIEVCWNIYPATAISSACLGISHLAVLVGVAYGDGELDRKTEDKVLEDGFDAVNKGD